VISVKFGSIDNHSPMRGHMGHPEASQGDLENQPVLGGIDKIQGERTTSVSQTKSWDERDATESNAKVRGNIQPL
jgi:hypothetical protein